MEERSEYQVLAPDSVAWYIQAALVADRTGNVTARDVALSEAQRIAQERRPVQPYDDCRTTAERISHLDTELHHTNYLMHGLANRLDALEAAGPAVADGRWMGEIEQRLDALEKSKHITNRGMNSGFAAYNVRFDGLANRLDALEKRQPNDAYIQMHGQRLADIERYMADLQRSVTYLENLAQGIVGPDAGL